MAANVISSDLGNLISELRDGKLDESTLLCYFAEFLIDAGADSRVVVDVLERDKFGEEVKDLAIGIKIREGF